MTVAITSSPTNITIDTTAIDANTLDRIRQIYSQPLPDLMFEAQRIHREHHDPRAIQLCTLGNIKSGACPEDCGYCSQSVHNSSGLAPEPLMQSAAVLQEAQAAKASGSTRFCMGAAWREVKDGPQFDRVLDMVRDVAALDMEVCCTLGMLKPHQAQQLKEAGLTAYNHNLDTSPSYYEKVITSRTYNAATTHRNPRIADGLDRVEPILVGTAGNHFFVIAGGRVQVVIVSR